jgi:hypothetical protein
MKEVRKPPQTGEVEVERSWRAIVRERLASSSPVEVLLISSVSCEKAPDLVRLL